MLVGSFVCYYATRIEYLILGRFIQGIGSGAGASLWRSVFRDAFEGDLLARYGSYLSIVIVLIIPIAPTLGGYLQETFGWRSVFQFLILYSLIALILVCFLYGETNKHRHPERLSLIFYKKAFYELLSSRVFMGCALCTFLCFGATFSWFTIGPILLIDKIGLSPVEFGWICSLGGGIAMALGGYVNGKLVVSLGSHTMLRLGLSLMILGGVIMMILYYIAPMKVLSIVVPFILFTFGVTFIWPNVFAKAFTPFGHIAGYAGALYSFFQIGGGAVMGSLAAFLPDENQIPLAGLFIFCPVLAWIILEHGVHPRKT
jgi:DHA1 family bicyclomycin/chloramphenicol resistance-like MFS transporter/DHA1 family 2-module integral membrane pump EmrD-like MFS transporter